MCSRCSFELFSSFSCRCFHNFHIILFFYMLLQKKNVSHVSFQLFFSCLCFRNFHIIRFTCFCKKNGLFKCFVPIVFSFCLFMLPLFPYNSVYMRLQTTMCFVHIFSFPLSFSLSLRMLSMFPYNCFFLFLHAFAKKICFQILFVVIVFSFHFFMLPPFPYNHFLKFL